MKSTNKNNGMALVVSLTLAMALLIFAVSFTRSLSELSPQTAQLLVRSQLDILAEGLLNYAVLKYKELPSDFYYAYQKAYIASGGARDITPLNVFQSDDYLRGSLVNPNNPAESASFTTRYELLAQKKYTADTLLITTTIEMAGVKYDSKRIIHTTRQRAL